MVCCHSNRAPSGPRMHPRPRVCASALVLFSFSVPPANTKYPCQALPVGHIHVSPMHLDPVFEPDVHCYVTSHMGHFGAKI